VIKIFLTLWDHNIGDSDVSKKNPNRHMGKILVQALCWNTAEAMGNTNVQRFLNCGSWVFLETNFQTMNNSIEGRLEDG
jgi:hypothetical protein